MERPVTPEPSEEVINHIPNAPKKKKKAPRFFPEVDRGDFKGATLGR